MAGKKDIVEQALKMVMGAADEVAPVSRIGMDYRDVTKRVPELTEAAKRIQAGEIGQPEYSALVDRFKPVEPYASIPDPASVDDMVRALTANKRDKIGKLADYPEGHPVALRLDIPAYTGHGVWVPTIHDQKTFKSISHEPAAHITGAQFSIPENKALAVAAGGAKGPFATIDGSLLKTPPEAIHERAKSVLNDPDWVQVGMDPERHSYFYDRKTMQPVMSAEEVIQVGPLVLARKPVYGNAEDFKYSEGGSVREGYGPGGIIDDVVRLAGKVISGEGDEAAQAGIRAYHGSPHDFDKFDMSKIGTGEGAQAYGHGLYFADREGIAKSYRDTLSPKNYLLNAPESEIAQKYGQDVLDMFSSHGGDPNEIKDTINRLSEQNKRDLYDLGVSDVSQVKPQNDWGIEANLVNRADRLNRLQSLLASQDVKINPGHMYEVNIAADPNTFLDWDKPLSEQPDIYEKLKSSGKLNVNEAVVAGTEKRLISLAGQLGINDLVPIRVQSGLRRGLSLSDALTEAKGATQNPEWSAQVDKLAEAILPTGVEMKGNLPQNWTGQSLVDSKVNGLTKRQVSEILSKEGIPGIKYLDAGSRGAGDGTRNYVVFDDKLISIIRKYGIAGASAMLGYNLMENLDSNQARAATAADMDYQKNRPQKSEGGARTEDPYAEEIATAKALMAAKAYENQPWSEWAGDVAQNAVNTAKSILPTALGGRGEVGISDIARGAYEAGKDAVTFPGDVISGKQALFDDRGRPLESAVGRSFNAASTLGGASSVVPRPSNSLGVFGGIKSLTADKPAIRKAMAMESKGANRDDIWTETGWGRGADTFWRYEIPDTGSTVDSSALEFDLSTPSTRRAKLGDYLQHPEFFAAYPQFKNMEVSTFPTNSNYQGMYYPRYDRGTINPGISEPYITLNEDLLSSGAAQRSTLLHELQHAVQQKEGFAPGTNISAQASGRTNPAVERYENAVKNDPEMKELMSIRSSMDYKKDIDAANEIYTVEYRPAEYEIDRMNIPKEEKNAKYDALMADYDKRVNGMFPNLGRVKELENNIRAKNIPLYYPRRKILTPMESYLQYSGEIEARNVQDRRDWERGKLRAIPPWNTQDYPFEDHLFPENDVTWKFGYADGGEVDDDINDALRIAKDVGGGTPVMMEDAKGNKYDAQGNVIPQESTGPNPQRTEAAPQQNVMFNTAPQNYSQDVQPFIDYAVTPIDRPGTPSEPDLVNVMRIATQVAAQGQPTDDRGQGNFARRRSETVRSLAGASPEGYQSDYKGPFTYNAGDTADFLNTLIDFSPYGALEYAHDVPYEAGRTGDYGTAAVEGGLGALMTTPGIALAGRGIKKGYELAKQFPKLTAGAIGAGAATTGSDEAEAGKSDIVRKALRALAEEGGQAAQSGIRAYHASPHDFDKFEWSPRTFGTGEGAQSYGAGLYFAESPLVSGRGGTYDQQFTRKLLELDRNGGDTRMARLKIGDQPLTSYGVEYDPEFIESVKSGNEFEYAQKRLNRWHELSTDESYPFRDYAVEKTHAWEKLLNDMHSGKSAYYPTKSRIYEVDINARPAQLLDWDTPIKEQSGEIQRAVKNLPVNRPLSNYSVIGKPVQIDPYPNAPPALKAKLVARDGGVPYTVDVRTSEGGIVKIKGATPEEALSNANEYAGKAVKDLMSRTGGDLVKSLERGNYSIPDRTAKLNATSYLYKEGIPGLRYLDAGSRSGNVADPTRNYVIWNDSLIDIKKKYEQGGRVTGGNAYDSNPTVDTAIALTREY